MPVACQRHVDFIELGLCGVLAVQAADYRQGLFAAPLQHQVTRAFGDEHQRDQEQRGGDGLHPEHPAPGGLVEPQRAGGGAGRLGQQVVAEEGAEQAGDDRDLLHGGQASTVACRRHLGDVGGRDDAGGAHGEAADHACGDEPPGRHGRARSQRRNQEQHGGDEQDRAAPPQVGHAPGEERADHAAEQHRGDFETDADGTGAEGRLQPVDAAVDDSAVEAEQEAAQRGHAADLHDQARVFARLCGGGTPTRDASYTIGVRDHDLVPLPCRYRSAAALCPGLAP